VSPLDKEYLIEEASGLIKIPGLEHKNSPLKREVPAVGARHASPAVGGV